MGPQRDLQGRLIRPEAMAHQLTRGHLLACRADQRARVPSDGGCWAATPAFAFALAILLGAEPTDGSPIGDSTIMPRVIVDALPVGPGQSQHAGGHMVYAKARTGSSARQVNGIGPGQLRSLNVPEGLNSSYLIVNALIAGPGSYFSAEGSITTVQGCAAACGSAAMCHGFSFSDSVDASPCVLHSICSMPAYAFRYTPYDSAGSCDDPVTSCYCYTVFGGSGIPRRGRRHLRKPCTGEPI